MSSPKQNSRPFAPRKFVTWGLLAMLGTSSLLSAQEPAAIEFSDQTAFDRTFTALKPPGETMAGVTTLTTGQTVFEKTGKGTISFILNQDGKSPAAVDGNSSTEVTASFRIVGDWKVASFGLWAGVNEEKNGGWLALINLLSPSEVRIRIFGRESDPGSEKMRAPLLDQTFETSSTLEKSAFYRLRFQLNRGKGQQSLSASLLPENSDEAVAEAKIEDSASHADGENLVGVRFAGERLLWKNFSVTHRAQ